MSAELETVVQELEMGVGKTWNIEIRRLFNNYEQHSAKPPLNIDSSTLQCGEETCFFRFSYEWDFGRRGRRYTLSIVAETRKEEYQSFDISAYLDGRNGASFFSRKTIRKLPHRLLEFSEHEMTRRGFHHDGWLKFFFLFHGPTKLPTGECAVEDVGLRGLSDDFHKMWKEGPKLNVELKTTDNQTVMMHDFILKARSEANLNMLPRMENIETLRDVVRYMYDAVVPAFTEENERSLYLGAIAFGIPSLQRRCADSMISSMTEDNAFSILQFGDEYRDIVLKNNAIAYILRRKLYRKDTKWIPFTERHGNLALEVLNVLARDRE